jgi:integrase
VQFTTQTLDLRACRECESSVCVTALDVLREVEARGALDIIKRQREHDGQISRFAIASGKARRDPAADLRGALKAAPSEKHRATLPRNELPAFLPQLDSYDGDAMTRLALRLIILTLVRTKELRGAEWREFEDLGGDAPLWRIPALRMKMPREHLVPPLASGRRNPRRGNYIRP